MFRALSWSGDLGLLSTSFRASNPPPPDNPCPVNLALSANSLHAADAILPTPLLHLSTFHPHIRKFEHIFPLSSLPLLVHLMCPVQDTPIRIRLGRHGILAGCLRAKHVFNFPWTQKCVLFPLHTYRRFQLCLVRCPQSLPSSLNVLQVSLL
ncbi:hypothetical protein B0H14DRAFT_2691444, partial [Mycena olivaceomarginata]